MSATNRRTEPASDFVRNVSEDPELKEFVAEHGLEKAADRAGYDLSRTEMETAIREFVKEDLSSAELDVNSGPTPGLSAHSGCSRCCR